MVVQLQLAYFLGGVQAGTCLRLNLPCPFPLKTRGLFRSQTVGRGLN